MLLVGRSGPPRTCASMCGRNPCRSSGVGTNVPPPFLRGLGSLPPPPLPFLVGMVWGVEGGNFLPAVVFLTGLPRRWDPSDSISTCLLTGSGRKGRFGWLGRSSGHPIVHGRWRTCGLDHHFWCGPEVCHRKRVIDPKVLGLASHALGRVLSRTCDASLGL